jgi:hypothetical protein
MRVLLLVPLLLLTACSAGGEDSLATGTAPESVLSVRYDPGDGTPAETWSLDCAGGGDSSHPDADAACAALEALDDPFAPLPEDMMCTEQYGGPQEALVTGTWRGDEVDLQVSRRNGCEIAQWDSLVPLLPAPS